VNDPAADPGDAVRLSHAGLVGKMPFHGDFVARGTGGADRSGIDQWLAMLCDRARSAFGADYEERFDDAPPVRFAHGVGAPAGVACCAGAVVASVDRVGRRFPLMLWFAASDPAEAATAELLAYDALAEGWDADCLFRELQAQAAGADPAEGGPGPFHWWIEDADGSAVWTSAGEWPEDLLTEMLRWASTPSDSTCEERSDAV